MKPVENTHHNALPNSFFSRHRFEKPLRLDREVGQGSIVDDFPQNLLCCCELLLFNEIRCFSQPRTILCTRVSIQ